MTATELVKMSAKGQLVVPEAIRDKEGFREGDRFVAVPVKEGVLFRRIELKQQFERLMRESEAIVRKEKIPYSVVDEAVKWARKRSINHATSRSRS